MYKIMMRKLKQISIKKPRIQTIIVISNVLLAFAAFVTIFFSYTNTNHTKKTLEVSIENSILSNRPYVFINPLPPQTTIVDNLDDKNLLGLTFGLSNTGKSTANKVKLFIKEAKLFTPSPQMGWDWNVIQDEKIQANSIDIMTPTQDIDLCLFPQQQATMGNVILKKEKLQTDWKENKKEIYLHVILSYNGLPFSNKIEEYKTDYKMVIIWENPQYSKIFITSKEISGQNDNP